ncbi:hypothetical protein ONA22_01210 [Mycoplasmopsis cynos]|nr:hypothetical protein [Mycoplasmopsis cynos]WAM03662.1 hypothetical protein ONA22_01210 [Mycoplasmopsis cynos]
MLAHVAYRHACVAVSNILNKLVRYSNKTVPACIYTHPEIAVVGLTEEQAKAQGKDVIVAKHQFTFVGKSLAARSKKDLLNLLLIRNLAKLLDVILLVIRNWFNFRSCFSDGFRKYYLWYSSSYSSPSYF